MSAIFSFVVVLCLSVVSGTQYQVNDQVDSILKTVKDIIVNDGLTSYPLPDYYMQLKQKFIFWYIYGYFEVKGGSLVDLSSLERLGDAYLDVEGDESTLTVSIRLATLQATYSQTSVKMVVYNAGVLAAQCPGNSFSLSITLTNTTDSCYATANSVSLDTLGSCSVTTTGGGLMNNVRSIVSNKLNNLDPGLRETVNQQLLSLMSQAFSSVDVCKIVAPYIPADNNANSTAETFQLDLPDFDLFQGI